MCFHAQGLNELSHCSRVKSHGDIDLGHHWLSNWLVAWLHHKFGSTSAQLLACCLMPPSHYVNKYWLIFRKVKWHSSQDNFIRNAYPNGPEAGREAGWGSEFVPLKKREVGSFILLHKISRTTCCFGIRTFLKQYNCYGSATIWYTDHQDLAQYSEIINNLWEIPLIFCNYAVRSCGTWHKGPGQSPCNVLSISDLELYVTETSMVFVTPSQIKMWYACVNHCK